MKKFFKALTLLALAASSQVHAQAFPLFKPANGILKGQTSTYVTTAAAASDVYALWSGSCSSSNFLRGDGACALIALASNISGTLGVSNGGTGAGTLTGPIKGNGTSAFTAAASADIYALWSGSCDATHFLRGDGACAVPPGTAVGTVTTTGSPASGNITKFSGSSSITNGDLSGDATTSGTLATTVAKVNGTSVPTNAAADQAIITTGSAVGAWKSVPVCTDTGGNHLNYDTSTHTFSCGTSSSGGAGSVTTTGSPASGNLSKFSGATSITNGDLSGDCTTSGTLAITCTKTNGVSYAASATTDTTSATNITSGTLSVNRFNSGINADSSHYLRGDGTWQTIGSSGAAVMDVQVFTSAGSNTWTKPSGSPLVTEVLLIGAGGGGGGGTKASSSNNSGGCGGGGAGTAHFSFATGSLGSTVTITLGTGGTAGTGATSNLANGGNGGIGGNSTFGSSLTAYGGGGGGGGTNSGGQCAGGTGGGLTVGLSAGGTPAPTGAGAGGGTGGQVGFDGTLGGGGGGGNSNNSAGKAGGNSMYGAAGGGSGGGINSGGASPQNGAAGGITLLAATAGTAGTSGATGGGGQAPATGGYGACSGGGGGGAVSASTAGSGGAGCHGSGGGGAGSSETGNGGTGGAGGDGYALVITYY